MPPLSFYWNIHLGRCRENDNYKPGLLSHCLSNIQSPWRQFYGQGHCDHYHSERRNVELYYSLTWYGRWYLSFAPVYMNIKAPLYSPMKYIRYITTLSRLQLHFCRSRFSTKHTYSIISFGEGYVAFYATLNHFPLNKICLNQFHLHCKNTQPIFTKNLLKIYFSCIHGYGWGIMEPM